MTIRTRRAAAIVTLALGASITGVSTASAGGGCHGGVTEGRGTRIEMLDACFTPTTLFAEPGDTITFVNRDEFAHNVTANGWGNFEDLGEGERYTTSFADEGVYAYACTLHPGMSGSIVIGEADAGADAASVDTLPVAAAVPASDDRGWIATGAAGLLIGAAAGAGIATVRRRSAGA